MCSPPPGVLPSYGGCWSRLCPVCQAWLVLNGNICTCICICICIFYLCNSVCICICILYFDPVCACCVRFSVGILARNSVFEPFPVGFFVRLEFYRPVWPPSLISSQWGMYWVNMSLSCAFWVPKKARKGQKQGLNDPKKVVWPPGDPIRPFFGKIITFP